MTAGENKFQAAVSAHGKLMEGAQVPRDQFLASISEIESAGTAGLSTQGHENVTAQSFGEAMLIAIGDIENQPKVRPPLTARQKSTLGGKIIVYQGLAVQGVGENPVVVSGGQSSTTKRKP